MPRTKTPTKESTAPTKETTSFTSGMTSQSEYSVQSNLLDAKIRTQKLHQKTHQLRGETAKAEKKSLWADTQEVLRDTQAVVLGIAQDNLAGKEKERTVNQGSIAQRLAARSYAVDLQRHKNSGTRQSLLNGGIETSFNHENGFEAVTQQQ